MNVILITHLIVAPVLLAASLMMKIWPPKKSITYTVTALHVR